MKPMSIKLHLGCGDRYLPGFTHVDMRDGPNIDHVSDFINEPFKFMDVAEIYMCHSLEHIPMNDVPRFLRKCYACMSKSGRFYISVPSFEILAALYLSRIVNLANIVRAIHGGQEYEGNLHYMSYDSDLLSSLLLQAGFKTVESYSPIMYLPENYSDTSLYRINGKLISLNLVAVK
jgi:predicted SAM-dependent methyltransferase